MEKNDFLQIVNLKKKIPGGFWLPFPWSRGLEGVPVTSQGLSAKQVPVIAFPRLLFLPFGT